MDVIVLTCDVGAAYDAIHNFHTLILEQQREEMPAPAAVFSVQNERVDPSPEDVYKYEIEAKQAAYNYYYFEPNEPLIPGLKRIKFFKDIIRLFGLCNIKPYQLTFFYLDFHYHCIANVLFILKSNQ